MIFHIITVIEIYAILTISLNLVVGYTGLFSLGHAAFFGIGAYTSAILTLAGVPFWFGLIAGGVLTGIVGWLIGYSTLKMKGDYFAIATLAFGEIARTIFLNWMGLTRGPLGLPGIPRPSIFGYQFNSVQSFAVLAGIFFIIVLILSQRLVNSPFGRLLKSIREDDIAAESLGKDVGRVKTVAVTVGSVFAGVGGSLYASFITYIDPSSFTLNQSIFILLLVVFGGLGNNYGSILGAALLVIVREGLRFLGLPPSVSAPLQQMIYSIALILLMLLRPRGIIGEKRIRSSVALQKEGE